MSWTPQRLLRLAARLSGQPEVDARVVEGVLGARRTGERFASSLNNDGSPLQICVSLRGDGQSVRLVGDPHADVRCARTRAIEAVRCAYQAARRWGAPSARPLLHATVSTVLPPAVRYHLLDHGATWLGARAAGGEGFAAYFTLGWAPEPRRPEIARSWLREVLVDATEAVGFVDAIQGATVFSAAAIEGHGAEDMRFKLYVYLRQPAVIYDLGVPLLERERFDDFLNVVMQKRSVGLDGLLLSCAFDRAGRPSAAKVDLCGHCLAHGRETWRQLVDTVSESQGIARFPWDVLADAPTIETGFVGWAVERDASPRMNLYFKEPQDDC
ncbi:MAG: hypothetical protein KC731_30705 [Myxococcales bacterium]|nr:hypothetical protein [Myxococcales bacterium]